MRKKLILNKDELTKILVRLVEQSNDEYYRIPADEYIELMNLSGYHGKGISKLPKFGGKKLWIDGNVNLSNTPTDSLGNVGYVNGVLNISNTNIKNIDGVVVSKYVSDSGTPRERIRIAKELSDKMEIANDRRESGEWEIPPDTDDEIALKANALFRYLVGEGDIEEMTEEENAQVKILRNRLEELELQYEESEDPEEYNRLSDEISNVESEIDEITEGKGDVYYLSKLPYNHYGDLTQFEILLPEYRDRTYSVGTESEMDDALLEYCKSLIDDVGIDGFRKGFIDDYIDEDYLKDFADDYYTDDVNQNWDVYFNPEDYKLTSEQEERIEELQDYIGSMEELRSELETEQEELESEIEDPDEYSDKWDEVQAKIDEIDSNIEKAQDEIDGIVPDEEPTQQMIDDAVEERVDEAMNDPISFIENLGLDIKNFIDEDALAQGMADSDGYTAMNSYDGTYDTVEVNGVTYYIMRTN